MSNEFFPRSDIDIPCWISDVIQLPNFYNPGSVLKAGAYAESEEEYYPVKIVCRTGRDIMIPVNIHKYKIEISSECGTCDIIGISTADFWNIGQLYSGAYDNQWFFPIYAHGSTSVLFVDSIKDLFSTTNIVTDPSRAMVVSPMNFMKKIDDLMATSIIPDNVITDLAFFRRNHSIMDICGMMMTGGDTSAFSTIDSLLMDYDMSKYYLPSFIKKFSRVRSIGCLRQFLRPNGIVPSDVAISCISMMDNYPNIKDMLERSNALPYEVADTTVCCAEDMSITGKWITGIFMEESSAFSFEISCTGFNIQDQYARVINEKNGFKSSFSRMHDSKHFIDYLVSSFALQLLNRPTLKVERTWLEDLVVRDPTTNETLLYIDLVWWVLASSDGLLNLSILNDIKLY